MSGGTFSFSPSILQYIAEELESEFLENFELLDYYDDDENLEYLKNEVRSIIPQLNILCEKLNAIDFFIAGDSGLDRTLEKLKKISTTDD